MRLRTDHMTYMDGMEIILMIFWIELYEINSYNPLAYSESDVVRAIKSDRCSIDDFKALSPAADKYLDQIAESKSLEREETFR